MYVDIASSQGIRRIVQHWRIGSSDNNRSEGGVT